MTTKGQEGSGGLKQQEPMQDGGPNPKAYDKKVYGAKTSPNKGKKPSQRLLRGPSGEALGSPTASDRAIFGKDQNPTSYMTERFTFALHLTSASSTTGVYPLYGSCSSRCTEKRMQGASGIARQRSS
eukprot:2488441-Pleurochrysis_carterae.AAC.2